MRELSLKERLAKGDTVLGSWNVIPSPSVAEIAGYNGLDFIVIDMEHGPISFETAENMVRAARVSAIASVVRISANRPELIAGALDIGSCGVQIPHISTKEEAVEAVKSAKYYPEGSRGVCLFTRASQYGAKGRSHITDSNKDTTVILNIEGVEGIANLEQIVSVEGIDVVFVGPYDLSQSLGKPGQVACPEVVKTIKRSAKIINDSGLICGSFAKDRQYLKMLIDYGVRYITYGVDSALISESYQNISRTFSSLVKNKDRK